MIGVLWQHRRYKRLQTFPLTHLRPWFSLFLLVVPTPQLEAIIVTVVVICDTAEGLAVLDKEESQLFSLWNAAFFFFFMLAPSAGMTFFSCHV